MKNIFKKINVVVAIGLASMLTLSSCSEDDVVSFSQGANTNLENSNSYLQVVTPVVSFQAGTETYDIQVNAIQGFDRIVTLKVISTFTDAAAATGLTADPVVLQTVNITANTGERVVMESSLTYDDLRAGVTLNGNPLSSSDFDLAVGASWRLTFEAVYEDGSQESLAGSINVAVLSPYAGLYEVLESAYYRINVSQGDWNGETRFIGSVDESTFSHEYVGPLFTGSFGVNPWTFTINFDTNVITAPADPDNALLGTDQRNCVDNASAFVNVPYPCSEMNVLIPDNVNGNHIIKLQYGYFNATGDENEGTREFFEILEKI